MRLERYHAGAITAAEVIQAMVEIRQEALRDDERKQELGLSDEELAFYDAIKGLQDEAYDMPFLRDLVHAVVEAVKNNLKVDWTKPHLENVKAGVLAAVKMVLRRRKVRMEAPMRRAKPGVACEGLRHLQIGVNERPLLADTVGMSSNDIVF